MSTYLGSGRQDPESVFDQDDEHGEHGVHDELYDHGEHEGVGAAEPDEPADEVVEVRRDGPFSALVAALAGGVALLYLFRVVGGGSALDWVVLLLMGAVAVAHAAVLVDSRAPLMVLDSHGVRVRRGRVWQGVAWSQVTRVEHTPRAGLLRDGRLEVTDTDDRTLAVRLSLSIQLIGADWHELTEALVDLADGHTHVVERVEDDEIEAVEDFDAPSDLEGDWLAGTRDPEWAAHDDADPELDDPELDDQDEADPQDLGESVEEAEDVDGLDEVDEVVTDVSPSSRPDEDETQVGSFDAVTHEVPWNPVTPEDDASSGDSSTPGDPVTPVEAGPAVAARSADRAPAPLRDLVTARRSEVLLDRRSSSVEVGPPVSSGPVLDDLAPPAVSETSTIVFDDALMTDPTPVVDPVIGPELAAARTRIGLGVDQLAARTRIRPHVIEAIEVDDFAPCGGDFYARGHLRTLARVLGVEVEPLLDHYEERYSDAPIDPRRVFSTELATGREGSLRGTRGGFNWSVLVAAVMAVVLVWSVARLMMDGPAPLADQTVLNGSPGGQRASLSGASTDAVPVTVTAATGGASVIVRDGNRRVVFDDDIAFGQTAEVRAVPPVRISSTDGGVTVGVDGQDEGTLGQTGEDAQQIFVPRD